MFFSTNITNHTKHIVMIFRKKCIISENPIIASKTIHSKEFESFQHESIETGTFSSKVKTLHIFSHQKQNKKENNKSEDFKNKSHRSKYLCQMQIQLTFTAPYSTEITNEDEEKKEKRNSKSNKIAKNPDNLDYQKIESENYNNIENPYNNENCYNNSLF